MYTRNNLSLLMVLLLFGLGLKAQPGAQKLERAYNEMMQDAQLQQASVSLYVLDAANGSIVFDRNGSMGLAPASTQKVITAATAYALLGREFRYQTRFAYGGRITNGVLDGKILVQASGDPTLGSWRWKAHSDSAILKRVGAAFDRLGIGKYGGVEVSEKGWEGERIPDGWIWQDIGNYYGAGAGGFNWRENQFDLVLRSGSTVGDPVSIVATVPAQNLKLSSQLRSAAKGSGDNAYVYFPLYSTEGVVRGTIPVDEKRFTISAAHPQPAAGFVSLLEKELLPATASEMKAMSTGNDAILFHTEQSPKLDSINYWFLRRSINLYGEALLRTLAFSQKGRAVPSEGVNIIRNFWKDKSILPTELNMVDGSGLSPLNRVTTRAQVQVLRYARSQPWFEGFYDALPEFNGMKMKSGTISGAKAFCGYHQSKDGKQYIFSFIINNYNGSSSALVRKMYAVLDQLK